MLRITHGVLLLSVAKHTLYRLFSAGINLLATLRLPKLLSQIQMLLPDVAGQDFLPFIIGTAQSFMGAIYAMLRTGAIGSLALSVRRGMPQNSAMWAGVGVV